MTANQSSAQYCNTFSTTLLCTYVCVCGYVDILNERHDTHSSWMHILPSLHTHLEPPAIGVGLFATRNQAEQLLLIYFTDCNHEIRFIYRGVARGRKRAGPRLPRADGRGCGTTQSGDLELDQRFQAKTRRPYDFNCRNANRTTKL